VSLSGFINYLDVNNPNKHIRIIKVILIACCAVTAQIVTFRGTVVMKSTCQPWFIRNDLDLPGKILSVFLYFMNLSENKIFIPVSNTVFKVATFCSVDRLPSYFIGNNRQMFNLIMFCWPNDVTFMSHLLVILLKIPLY
jgi:hypothetical protein